MDEIKRLEREIQSLQAQLRQQNTEASKARQNLINENRRKLKEYEQEMKRAIRTHDEATKAEYERLLKQYERSLGGDVQSELARINSDYSRLLNDVKRNEEMLLQKNRELEEAIAAIRKDVSQKNAGNSREAKTYLQNAVETFRGVEVKPHEKFTPKRLKIFFDELKDGEQLFKAGLFEAATAVAISAKSGLERLGYNIDDKVDEWDKQYDLFVMKLTYLQTKVTQELADWEEYIGDESGSDKKKRAAHLIEINYWSRGEFASIFQIAKKYQQIIAQVNQTGKDAYLKIPDGASTDDLKKYIEEIDKTDKQLTEVSAIYKKRYTASCERADWGEAIIDFLTNEINLEWHEEMTGYRKAAAAVVSSKDFKDYVTSHFEGEEIDEDTREWLKMVFENSSENLIYIYIVPMESKGKVVNRIILHIDYGGPEQEMYSRDIYEHICEAIELTDESEGVVNYASDINELKISTNKVYSETGKDLERMKRRN